MSLLSVVVGAVKEGPQSNLERRLLAFVLLNYSFCFFEIFYGSVINSLGLVCDGIHVSINCIGISLSWIALRIAHYEKAKPNLEYSFGYGRVQVLAAFVNGIVLIFVCLMLFVQAASRFFEPEELDIHSGHAIVVAGSSLILNILGLLMIVFVKVEGEQTREFNFSGILNMISGIPDYKKSDDLEGSLWTHSKSKEVGKWLNIQSVMIHLKSDILSSLGLLCSSVLVHSYNLKSCDTLVSIAILTLILRSATPLVVDSGRILLQAMPVSAKPRIDKLLRDIGAISGVIECHEHHCWAILPSNYVVTLKLRIRDDSDRRNILQQAHNIAKQVAFNVTIQIVTDSGMHASTDL
mmetsp:Transcript_18040/g.23560  ORF Transcript_18040/g.23560 Transcript_18040/m.23560 type:complete len:351 (+) Transcript_18040:182-1234(+)